MSLGPDDAWLSREERYPRDLNPSCDCGRPAVYVVEDMIFCAEHAPEQALHTVLYSNSFDEVERAVAYLGGLVADAFTRCARKAVRP